MRTQEANDKRHCSCSVLVWMSTTVIRLCFHLITKRGRGFQSSFRPYQPGGHGGEESMKSKYCKCSACDEPVIAASARLQDHWDRCKKRPRAIGQLDAGFQPSRNKVARRHTDHGNLLPAGGSFQASQVTIVVMKITVIPLRLKSAVRSCWTWGNNVPTAVFGEERSCQI